MDDRIALAHPPGHQGNRRPRGGRKSPLRVRLSRVRVPAMFLVTIHRSGPEWDAAKPMEEQSDWDAHAGFMDALAEEGFIVLGGPLADEVRVIHAIEAESEAAIRARLAEDPWSGSHLVIESIEPWTIRLDGR